MKTAEQLQRIEAAIREAGRKSPAAARVESGLEPIAIVGLSGYFPGCMSAGEFWRALEQDVSLLEEIPTSRFDWQEMFDPLGKEAVKSRSKWGGFIPDIRSFDPDFFGISVGEANAMDPRERLLLMAVYHALEDAGWSPAALRKTRTGVFVAGEGNEYEALARRREGGFGTGEHGAQVASRISYSFDFRGPSEFFNAMCAGGAVALNRAVRSLRAGEVTAAVVGAVNLILRPEPFIQLSGLDLLSPVREVCSFGKQARGFQRAEGVACVVLKRLSQAEAEGDPIYALIKNTAVSHNGRGGVSRNAPDPLAQAELIRACCQQVRLDPRRLDYIEAQGMGSLVPDLAEWRAFGQALRTMAADEGMALEPGKCQVGCLKPLIGHMEAASSLGALFKIIHSLRAQTIFGIHGFTEAHPELDEEGHPCALATQTRPWPKRAQPRVAGLNSYGMGGNNAHILIEEYVPRSSPPSFQPGLSLVVLSAPREDKLAQMASNLLHWIEEHPGQDIASLAFTLQVGRDEMNCRLALAVYSLEELGRGLTGYLNPGNTQSVFFRQGRAGQPKTVLPPLMDAVALGRFWVAGGTVPWRELHRGRSPQRISLPGYPFDQRACWLEEMTGPVTIPPNGKPLPEQLQDRLTVLLSAELGIHALEIDPRQHFMEYGIGSLAGLRLAQRLGRWAGASVGLRDWLENPTIEAFSKLLASRVGSRAKSDFGKVEQASSLCPNRPVLLGGQGVHPTFQAGSKDHGDTASHNSEPLSGRLEFPLSECQRGLWAIQKTRPESAAYNVPLCFRVFQRIEAGPWRQACQALLERYPLLGCRIAEREGHLRHLPAGSSLSMEEIEVAPSEAARLGDLLKERLRRPFLLEEGPLVRFHLVHCSPGESIILIVAHHLVMDGLSVAPVMTTLLDTYLALRRGIGVADQASEVDFGDFIQWEREQLKGESGQRLEAYWKEQLAGTPPALRLTAERPERAIQARHGETVSARVPGELREMFQNFSAGRRTSLSCLFLGLWKALLHRYSGADEVAVGVVAQVRPDDRFSGLAGYFINLLPIRTRDVGVKTFADLVQSLQVALAGCIDHAAYPFPRMVRSLGLMAEEGTNPLVQVGFEYQSYLPGYDLEKRYGGSLPLQQLEDPRQAGELDLVLEVVELAGAMDLHFKYDPAVYSEAVVRRMADHFLALARAVMADPTRCPGGYSLLSQSEMARILTGWNETQRDYSREDGAHDMVRRQARKTPEAVAVRFEEQFLTYGQLDRRSDALAGYLLQQGVKPDEPIAIWMERSPEMVVALLGILKAGGAYLPLDTTYPAERLAFMVRDSGAALLLTQHHLKAKMEFWNSETIRGGTGTVVELDRQWPEIESSGQFQVEEHKVAREQLAYLIYTSGTTGRPKGVMIPHRALVNFLVSFQREPGLRPEDRLLAVTNLSFDIAGLEIFLPLVTGAQCWICPAEVAGQAERLKETIRRARPTVMQATPSTWKMLWGAGWRNEERLRIWCGGEALPEELARAFAEAGMEAWNLYGPTETTIWSTLQRIEGRIGIGRPIANTRVYILDQNGQPVPIGVAGELWIAGEGLARGYWNRPDLTAEKFVEVPFRPGERAYKTGDLACWREDGTIQHLGRADRQVKLRGHRIELEEIEAHLNQHPEVRDAAVVVRECQGMRQLMAYCVPRDGNLQSIRPDQLEAHLRRLLPDYMIPAFFIPIEKIPLTPNGKTDRRSLMVRPVEIQIQGEPSPPASPLETMVLALWKEVLGVGNLSVTGPFFAVGGNSVSAVMLAERISRTLEVSFTTTDLFRYPTIRAMAAHLATLKRHLSEKSSSNVPGRESPGDMTSTPGPCPEYYRDSLAIIGISCQFPGAETHQAFWANLKAGAHSAVYFSPEELRQAGVPDHLARHPDFVPVQLTIEGKDCFDPDFFRIPAKNAALMDPQSRLLLMHSWKAIEDAGYVPADLAEAGVFMSVSNNFYSTTRVNAGSDLNLGENYVAWLMAQAGTVATTISYHLGLRGPSYAVHANCSSSLVAMHAAWQTLRLGECGCALVGAASLLPGDRIGYVFQEGMNLSRDGRCKAFDAAADGMVGGEGAAVLLVKRADLAMRDGDSIYAVIRGVGVNNDGSDKAGYYAPGVAGQAEVIEQVMQSTGVHPEQIGYVEAHGTGTKLGDPVEVAALSLAYGKHTARKQYCGIGSVKSNIGHLDTAAGLAGCVKAALSLKHRQIPPTLHFCTPNPAIPLADSPFYVADQLREWAWSGGPRRAGLSSLGLGGTNAHAILEECMAPESDLPPPIPGPFLAVLSAKNPDRLRKAAEGLLQFLEEPGELVSLADLAFTLQVGRVAMSCRLAFLTESRERLVEKLRAWLAGRQDVSGCWEAVAPEEGATPERRHETKAAAGSMERWMEEQALTQLAPAWVHGAPIDWKRLYGARRPRRISLPTYPFARERYRLAANGPAPSPLISGAPATGPHPLLRENVSIPNHQRYRSTFTGQEFYLADHVVSGRRILPGVAYLEMARAAVAHATGWPGPFDLKHVAWPQSFEVGGQPRALQIELRAGANGEAQFDISTPGQAGDSQSILLCQGLAVRRTETGSPPPARAPIQIENYSAHYSGQECYRAFQKTGIEYGPGFRAVVELWRGGEGVLAKLSLPASVAGTLDQFVLHPSLLDAAIHASMGYDLPDHRGTVQDGPLLLPFALEELEILGACHPEMWARVRRRDRPAAGTESETLDIELCDREGQIQVRMKGLFSRQTARAEHGGPVRNGACWWLARPAWTASDSMDDLPDHRIEEHHVVVCGGPARGGTPDHRRGDVQWLEVQLPVENPAGRFEEAARAVFQRIKAILEKKPKGDILLQVVVPGSAEAGGLQGLAALLRTARLENPRLFAQLIAIEPGMAFHDLFLLLQHNARRFDAVHIRYRQGKREVLRWEEMPAAKPGWRLPWRDGGIYLITGGAGGLGLIFAAEIGRRARNAKVILVGRSEASSGLMERLKILGVGCEYRRADVSQPAEVEALLARIRGEVGEPHGVLHAAGLLGDDFILRKSPDDFQRVLAPKVAGAINLDRAFGGAELDFFIVFSSISGVFGSVGQADYASANAFLDEFAEYRQGLVSAGVRHGRTLSINWPFWREGGMRMSEAGIREMTERSGFIPLETGEGLEAFHAALASGSSRLAVLSGHRDRINDFWVSLDQRRPESAASQASITEPSGRLETSTREWLRRSLAGVLEMPAHKLKEDEKFERYGVDSVLVVQLINHLETSFGSLPKTLFFEYQSLRELTDYFLKFHPEKIQSITGVQSGSEEPSAASSPLRSDVEPRDAAISVPSPTVPVQASPGDIAIIGLSGRYPQAEDLDQFWRNLVAGRDSITEVPGERWDWRKHYTGDPKRPGDHAGKWGGFIEGVDLFDPLFFNISPREAGLVDPQERLFLETVWNLLESAGYTRRKLRERHQGRVAVYAGAMYQQYHAIPSDVISEAIVSLSSFSGIANRVSYFFDFQGPSVAVDTMCSSSLAAIQMACDCLRGGQVSLAIAGAVNLSIHPHKFTGLTAAKLMGSHPGSRSFADGDGYLPAEGVGAVLLKPLAGAIRDGDKILAVIKAATTHHSGQSGGFGVPNPQAQARAVEDCVRLSGIDPRTISYVEASANGSPLGDAIEVKALSNALAKYVPERGAIPIGSVKSNLGHSEAASGLAQLAKVVLQMNHRRLVPSLKGTRNNPNIAFEETPFHLLEEGREWRPRAAGAGSVSEFDPRRALISSVGAGGSTGHLVLEEYLEGGGVPADRVARGGPWMIALSARQRGSLEAQARHLGEFLKLNPDIDLQDVAYTLHTGRESMDHRAALVVSSREELLGGLDELAKRLEDGSDSSFRVAVFIGSNEESHSGLRALFAGPSGDLILRELLARKEHAKLAAYWVNGGEIQWEALYEGTSPRIVSLPTYPFEKRRCWLPEAGQAERSTRPAPPVVPNDPGQEDNLQVELVVDMPDKITTFLKTTVAEVLGLDLDELSPAKALNLFGFGSIDAVTLKSKLEQELSVEVPIACLSSYQSLEEMESQLRPLLGQAPGKENAFPKKADENWDSSSMRPELISNLADRYQPFPLSDIQESFYLGRKINEQERTGCHIYFEIARPDLDLYRLNTAWNRLVRRHEMLRAVMLPGGRQRILEETAQYRFPTADLRRQEARAQVAHLARWREELSHRVYDPEQWPLFEIRVSILPDRRIIHFSIDELIVDALSIELLFQEWHGLYEQPDLEWPALELSFRDYVLAVRSFANSTRAQRDLEYWRGKLRQMPPGPLLPGFEMGAVTHRCARLEASLGAATWAALKRRAEALNVSPTALVLCLFAETLRGQSRDKAFSLILTFLNRLPIHPQVDRILGPFISTSLFVVEASRAASLPEQIRQTQRQLWDDLDHNSISGIRALRELKRLRTVSGTLPLPVVFTSMLGLPSEPHQTLLKDVSFSVTQTPQVYLDHQLYEQSGELHFSWDVVRECFAAGCIDALFRDYCQLLEKAATEASFWENSQWPLHNQSSQDWNTDAGRDLRGISDRRGQAVSIPMGGHLQVTGTDRADHSNDAPEILVRAHPEDRGQPFPLTDQQQAYAFGRSEHGSLTPSNVYMEFEAGEMDVDRLEAAWRRVMEAHSMLATTITAQGVHRRVEPVPAHSIRLEDFSGLDQGALREALEAVEREMTARICPLGGWPFFELRLSRLGGGRMMFHFCMDMILADPASIDFLAQELFDAYAAPTAALAAPSIEFQDYLRHQREIRGTGGLATATEYWIRKFENVPSAPALPCRGSVTPGKTRRLSGMLEGWGSLKRKASEMGVQPSMILLAAYAEVLWDRSGGRPFTVVIPCWRRPPVHPEIYRVVGDFTTLCWLPVRRWEGTFQEKVAWCHREIQADLAHGAVSGLRVLRKQAMKMEPGQSNHNRFPVVFTDLSPIPAFRLPEGIRFRRSSSQTSQVFLDNISAEEGGQLGLYWDVARDIYPQGLMETMFEDYGRILSGLAVHPAWWEERTLIPLVQALSSPVENRLPEGLPTDNKSSLLR